MYSLTKDLKNPQFPIGILSIVNFLTNAEVQVLFTNKQELTKAKSKPDAVRPSYLQYNNENNSKINESRNSKIAWINYSKTNIALKNLFEKIYAKIIDVNENIFQFNLTDIEPFQFTSYTVGGYYKKHLDLVEELYIGNTQRKLSFTIQLTSEEDYDGGELCIYTNDKALIACKQKGSISFFPSFMLHEVTEVTRGERYSLVGWAHGPKFV